MTVTPTQAPIAGVSPGAPADGRTPPPIAGASPGAPAEGTLKSLHLRRLFITLPLALLGFAVFWGAVQGIFIPLQVQAIERAGQNGSLALIVGLGAIVSMIASPIAGSLSDRTRSRMGGRAPWLIIGAVTSLGLAIALSFATTILTLTICFMALQFTTALILTPASAYIVDRVPVGNRGMFSAAYGFASLGGVVVGQTIASKFAGFVSVGYLVVGGLLAALVLLFALSNLRSNVDEPKLPFSLRSLLSTFWVNPITHRNFALVFLGRFLLFAGYFPLWTFMLYLLQDYIGLGKGAVSVIPILGVANLIGSIVGTIVGGILVQRTKVTRPIIYGASALIVLALIFPIIWPTVPAMLTYSLIAGVGIGAYISVDLVLVTLVLPSNSEAGKDLGIINITGTLPQTIGVVFGVGAIALFGSYVALLPFAIIVTVLGAVLLGLIKGVK